MKMMTFEIKNKLRRETACLDPKTLIACSAACAVFCILTAVFNVKSKVYKTFTVPKLSLSPFFCMLFFVIASALMGAALAVIISSFEKNKEKKIRAAILCVCAIILGFSWIALVYSAASFLIAALVCAVTEACCIALIVLCARISRLAQVLVGAYSVWTAYLLYFSVGLAFLS